MTQASEHWDSVYTAKPTTQLSWHEDRPTMSLRLIAMAAEAGAALVDVGGGASFLADALVEAGWTRVTLLDVSAAAVDLVRRRLGERVSYVVADVLTWEPVRFYDVWHDRAVFHFLVTAEDQARYVATATRAVRTGGALVLGTFAGDGPTSCSGLPTARYDPGPLAERFARAFDLEHTDREEHVTPNGVVQPFTWVVLRRRQAS